MDFISELTSKLSELKNIENAKSMQAYMKDNFVFLGIKTKERRVILQNLWKKHQQEIKINFRAIAWELFNKKEREFHYCGVEIMIKEAKKKYTIEDIELIEKFIITHSWWDSVDFIAKYILGNYLRQFPNETYVVIERFSNANNMWLNRSTIIFQLDYKATTNFELLISECEKHKESNEFFIQKAIGWALREYGTFNPKGVIHYVENTNLKSLSKKEALRKLM
jgi:3-methyladenine DNA glycosylase AlkD